MTENLSTESTDSSRNLPTQAMLVSVGGASAPVLKTLDYYRPRCVWYFCSEGSREVADQIHAQLTWHPDRDYIEVGRFEELGPCYRELRLRLPELLRKWKVDPEAVRVDYTGGTKAMSAALVLAATEQCKHFSYVGGEQREKAGLGIVVGGTERVLYEGNPWSELAIREVERARDLWNHGLFEGAARVLEQAVHQVPRKLLFKTLADIASATAARHRLDFKEAVRLLGHAKKNLPSLYDGTDDFGLTKFAERSLTICEGCKDKNISAEFIRELLDNALRTAKQGRYEDASARLYRAMEMQAQLWLAEASNGAFDKGRLKKDAQIPAALADWEPCRPDESGQVRLSMELAFRAVYRLEDRRAEKVIKDLELGTKGSRWRQATEHRNASILGHGVTHIGADGFTKMKAIAAEFLGFELDREGNPIPDFDIRWVTARA